MNVEHDWKLTEWVFPLGKWPGPYNRVERCALHWPDNIPWMSTQLLMYHQRMVEVDQPRHYAKP
jgi:hypothetical protein